MAIGIIVYQFLKRRRLADDNPAQPLAEPERLPDAVLLMTRARAALEAGDTFGSDSGLAFKPCSRSSRTAGSSVTIRPGPTASIFRDLPPQPARPPISAALALPFDRAFYGKIRPETGDVEQTLKFCESLMSVGATS